ncbi:MAG: hypothetical protein N2C14_26730, partial [Planctomycetales bacterium]
GAALFVGFLISGIVHELVISVPAMGGLGLPTLYFLLQAGGVWVERKWLRDRGETARRLWAAFVVLAPIGLMFHGPFLHRVAIPFMQAIGVHPS